MMYLQSLKKNKFQCTYSNRFFGTQQLSLNRLATCKCNRLNTKLEWLVSRRNNDNNNINVKCKLLLGVLNNFNKSQFDNERVINKEFTFQKSIDKKLSDI